MRGHAAGAAGIAAVLLTATLAAAGEQAPPVSSVVEFFEGLGFRCEREARVAPACTFIEYPKPSYAVTMVVDGDRVLLLAFRTTPVDDEPIRQVPAPMADSVGLPFPDAEPDRVLGWLQECVEAVDRKARPGTLVLGSARYICSGEPNAPTYSVVWR